MSKVILDDADKLLGKATKPQEAKSVIGGAVLAWNLSLVDKCKYERPIDDHLTGSVKLERGSEHWHWTRNLLIGLIHKKKLKYPSLKQFILDFDFISLKDSPFNLMLFLCDAPFNQEHSLTCKVWYGFGI
jgi:hypothetical protein